MAAEKGFSFLWYFRLFYDAMEPQKTVSSSSTVHVGKTCAVKYQQPCANALLC